MPSYWERGEMSEFANQAGLRHSHFSDILHRRRGVSVERAKVLEEISGGLIAWYEWVDNKSSNHPAFFGDPQ